MSKTKDDAVVNITQHDAGERNLPVTLSDPEKMEKGLLLAQAEIELADLAAVFKSTAATFRGEKAELEKTIVALSRALENGSEMRDVACFEEVDLVSKMVRLIRKDTLETVSERDAESEELQGLLFGGQQ